MSRSSFKRPRLDEPLTATGSSSTSIVPISLSNAYNAESDDDDDPNSGSDGQDDFEFAEGYDDHAGPSGRDSGDEGDGWSEDEDDGGRSGKGTPAKGYTSSASQSRPSTPSSAKRTPTKRKAATPKKSPRSASKPKPAATTSGPFVRLTASDAYFTSVAQPLALNTLSSNIFSSLLPPLTHQAYTSLLAESSVAHKHEHELDDLSVEHERRWDGWVHELTSGWNLLFYGLGSKRDALNDFAVDRLSEEGDIVVVNGLYPRIGIREILAAVEEQFPELNRLPPPPSSFSLSTSSSTTTSTPLDILAYKIYTFFLPPHTLPPTKPQPKLASKPLFLLLHSLDSPSLRTPQCRSILSLLASSPRIHLLASIDHINAPSLFTTTEMYSRPHSYPPPSSSSSDTPDWPPVPPPTRGFNFLLHDLTTLRPYTDEVSWRTSSASRLSAGGAGAGAGGAGGGGATATEEGARHILVSVTGAAKKLFKLLAKNQIASQTVTTTSKATTTSTTTPAYATETSLFFRQCVGEWIAREETRFKALLAEFRDHRLVVESVVAPGSGAGGEGGEGEGEGGGKGKANARWLWIPLGKEALERLVGEIEAEE